MYIFISTPEIARNIRNKSEQMEINKTLLIVEIGLLNKSCLLVKEFR